MNYSDSVAFMNGLLRFGEKYGNERFEALLCLLGDPHRKFKALHIAGTKGKGSTTTFAASILKASGYRTGAYISPYVYDLRERIQIDGQMIPADDFAYWVTEIRPHMEALAVTHFGQTTEFELKTAVAFCWFASMKVDYAVVEVGLGGRLDATNVLPNPLVSVITNIGYDHMDILGNTLELIAAEKAGIIKQDGLCVTGIDGGPALDVVKTKSEAMSAEFFQVVQGVDWQTNEDGSLAVTTPARTLDGLNLNLRGRFQHANAALALEAIDRCGIRLRSDSCARIGLEAAFAPGRLEVIQEMSPTVVLDAAHNELAAEVLADSLDRDFNATARPTIIVAGLSRRHEPVDLLKSLRYLNPVLLIATEPSFRPRPADDTVKAANDLGFADVVAITPVLAATRTAVNKARSYQNALVVVTGSFFTVGDLPPHVRDSIFNKV